jgi:hypothetical protein
VKGNADNFQPVMTVKSLYFAFFAYKLYFPTANSGTGLKNSVFILYSELQHAAGHLIARVTDQSAK